MSASDSTTTKRQAPKKRPAPEFKQSPADSLMEELDKELDRRGFDNSPNKKPKKDKKGRVVPDYDPRRIA